MPPTSTDLDLFILALVQRGCATPYELKARAGISIGSSAPVLERLAQRGLLKKSDPRVRDSIQFSITGSGKKTLESGWQSLLAARPTDPDAILRITYLAWALGRQGVMMKFIDAAADALSNAAATRRAVAKQLQAANDNVGADAFRWLKTRFEAARLEAQSKELKELGEQIKKQKRK
jgi:DNA-binding PadR family transcriptional regulator